MISQFQQSKSQIATSISVFFLTQVTHYKPILNGTASLLALQINQLVNDMINS